MSTQDPISPRPEGADRESSIPATSDPAPPANTSDRAERPAAGSTGRADDRAPTVVELPEEDRQRVSASAWISLIVGAIILVLLLIFVIQNSTVASFTYLGLQFDLQLGVAMLLAAIAGALIAGMIGSVIIVRQGFQIRRLHKERDRIRSTLRG